MLQIIIYGMPADEDANQLPNLVTNIRKSITSEQGLKNLNIPVGEICVFFQADLLSGGLGDEIIAHVFGVKRYDGIREQNEPPVTHEEKDQIAQSVCGELAMFASEHFAHCNRVNVEVVDSSARASLNK